MTIRHSKCQSSVDSIFNCPVLRNSTMNSTRAIYQVVGRRDLGNRPASVRVWAENRENTRSEEAGLVPREMRRRGAASRKKVRAVGPCWVIFDGYDKDRPKASLVPPSKEIERYRYSTRKFTFFS